MADIIILSIIGLCVFFIIRSFVKKAKNKELGCGCGCSGCSGCVNGCSSRENAGIKS
ncbi:MAG: FeoB-associated Cys-rich membrane protein [Roseburia sp.]|nr:FeoB-associated Cys-rich membrane protein [Roseburia sp.]MCM1279603.1 FeoB-associated Cys-rich membrane protein [Robinsoniella sp.]